MCPDLFKDRAEHSCLNRIGSIECNRIGVFRGFRCVKGEFGVAEMPCFFLNDDTLTPLTRSLSEHERNT